MISRKGCKASRDVQSGEPPAGVDEFRLYDADDDARITLDEFCALLSSLGSTLAPAERIALFGDIDLDHDGFISEQEYVSWHRG